MAERARAPLAAFLITVVAGCVQAPVRPATARVEPRLPPSAGVATVPTAPPASVTGVDVATQVEDLPRIEPPPPRAEVKVGTGQFINAQAAARRPASTPAGGNVVFNWENVPIQEVVKAILGDVLQENYVIAPGVAGNVTFSTAQPITPNQAMGVLEMLLSWNNATLVYRDGRYTVTPINQAIPGNLTPRIGPAAGARGYELRVVPLKYISATEMEKILAPYIRPGAVVRSDNARNILVLGGTRADLTNYLETINVFDVNWLKGMSVGIFPLEQVDAKVVVPELEKIFGDAAGTPMAGMFRFLPIERTNSVMVITPQPEYLRQAEEWIGKLDRGSGAAAQLFVYYVKNVKATDLAEKLTEIFSASGSSTTRPPAAIGAVTPGVESVEISSLNRGTKEQRQEVARERAITQAPVTAAPNGITAQSGGNTGGGISIVESDNIRITSIEESNALLIKSTSSQYDSIESAIRRLDVVPLQVHIEARFLEVTLTDRFRFGVQSYFENLKLPGNPRFPDGVERGGLTSFGGSITPGGVAWTFLSDHADFLIDTLQSEGVVEVLAAPSVVVLNNKSANINVGTQIPVVSSFISGGVNPTPGQPNPGINPGIGNSFVQFRDTGITLDVTPRVNPGGLVYLEIKQEKSTPGAADTAVAGNVAVNKRTLETEIAVQSGQTVMLGGLISDEADRFKGGVPVLSKLPLVGGLFGSTNRNRVRQELIVLITPTVIGSAQEGEDLTREYRERFRQLKPLSDQVEAERLRGKARAEQARAADAAPVNP
ncbi:MAG: type II secretion system secretin GspD [Lysobacterales bacterium]